MPAPTLTGLSLEGHGQVVEGRRHVHVVGAESPYTHVQRPPVETLRLEVVTLSHSRGREHQEKSN